MAMVYGEKYLDPCSALARSIEIVTNRKSRTWSDRSEWKLSSTFFHRINLQLGYLSTDLFASRVSAQLATFVSWKPDPSALATDALILDWSTI